MGEVTHLPPPPPPPTPVVIATGVRWGSGGRLGTIPAMEDDVPLAFDNKGRHYAPMGTIVCRRPNLSFTCVLPAMEQKCRPEFLAMATNDNQLETD